MYIIYIHIYYTIIYMLPPRSLTWMHSCDYDLKCQNISKQRWH